MIGIIGAMNEEVVVIVNEMSKVEKIEKYNMTFYKGLINNKECIVVECGIGMVNSAVLTTVLINEFNVEKIYFSGVAGSLSKDLKIGDIVISTSLQEYLFDVTAFGYEKGVIPRMDNSEFKPKDILEEARIKLKDTGAIFGKIISGDKFVSSKLEKESLGNEFNALAVDMESASVAHVCYVLDKDFLIIRSISDSLVDESTQEFDEFVKLAAQNSKDTLLRLI